MNPMTDHPLAMCREGVTRCYYPFDVRPLSDSCWSLQTGPDGRVYIAACTEHTGGESATVLRYNSHTDDLDVLFDLDKVTGDLRDSGRATQCKIHYSFAPEIDTGILYCATHLSGPPKGETRYNPWAAWHDPVRAFRGAYLTAFNTRTDEVEWSRLMIPKEGCRCLCLDPERRQLYALTYPRDHFIIYDLASHKLRDLGRIGSVNSQCIFTDRRGRAYTFADSGHMIRFDPETDVLQQLPHRFPHDPCQNDCHGVVYDAVADNDSGAIYAVPWKARPHLLKFDPENGPNGSIEDLGRLGPPSDPRHPMGINRNHAGGLLLHDPYLYYVVSHWLERDLPSVQSGSIAPDQTIALLRRMHLGTGLHEDVCTLSAGAGMHHYISRAAMSAGGDLFFAKIMARPAGVYRVRIPDVTPPRQPPIRLWG
jgi:hypothetical protein